MSGDQLYTPPSARHASSAASQSAQSAGSTTQTARVPVHTKTTSTSIKSSQDSSSPNDEVNHPLHYTNHPSGIECIQITEHMNFNCGNAIKYIWRAGLKDQNMDAVIKDYRKAIFYLNRECARLTGSAQPSEAASDPSHEQVDR